MSASTGLRSVILATAEAFQISCDFREEDPTRVVLDVHATHIWDITGINALDQVVLKFRHHSIPIDVIGVNEASQAMVDRLARHVKEGAVLVAGGH